MTTRTALMVAVLAAVVILLAACGGSVPPAAEPTASPFVAALPADRAEMAIAAPDGSLPCGIAEVDWGYRIFRLGDFPACQPLQPNLAVYCLDGSGAWSAANVLDLDISTDTSTVAFNVQQAGICGLFPTSP